MEDVGKVRVTGLGVEGLGGLPNWTGGMWMYLRGERDGGNEMGPALSSSWFPLCCWRVFDVARF